MICEMLIRDVYKARQGCCEIVDTLLDHESFNVTDTDLTGSQQITSAVVVILDHQRSCTAHYCTASLSMTNEMMSTVNMKYCVSVSLHKLNKLPPARN